MRMKLWQLAIIPWQNPSPNLRQFSSGHVVSTMNKLNSLLRVPFQRLRRRICALRGVFVDPHSVRSTQDENLWNKGRAFFLFGVPDGI